jgi:hypothetical protein
MPMSDATCMSSAARSMQILDHMGGLGSFDIGMRHTYQQCC